MELRDGNVGDRDGAMATDSAVGREGAHSGRGGAVGIEDGTGVGLSEMGQWGHVEP